MISKQRNISGIYSRTSLSPISLGIHSFSLKRSILSPLTPLH